MKNGKLTVAIVGMGFGSCFLPIYLKHPDVEHVIMVDTNPDQLKALADMYLLDESYYTTDFEAVLQNPDVDAVHLVIPPALHAPMSVQVLNAGKHCACTIPMGMSMKELEDVIKARKASGKHYMFMETSVYTREYLYVKELYESGAMGKLQYMRCAHYQDMEGWPSYWDGFPPLAHPGQAERWRYIRRKKICRFPHPRTTAGRCCFYMPPSSSPHRRGPCPSMGFCRCRWQRCSHRDSGLANPVPFGV